MDNIPLLKISLMVLIPFIFVLLITPLIGKLAFKINAVDVPDGGRHLHNKITPKLGGIAIFLGFLLGYMIFGSPNELMISVLIGSFIIILIGVIDDITELPAYIQFLGQLIAACIVVFYGNILLNDIDAFGVYLDFGIFAYPITIFFILGAINCINLIDGLDGLSGGISSIYYLTIGIITIFMGVYKLDFVLTFVMLGSTLGFLVHNFYPATIFAGDCGSNFMGFIIAVIALLGFKNVTMTSLIIPVLILAIPILDTFFAIIRRLIKGENPTKSDQFHIHHQLLNKNFSVKTTVIIIYAIDILFALASIFYVLKDQVLGYIIYSILLIIVLLFVFKTTVIYDPEYNKNKGDKKN